MTPVPVRALGRALLGVALCAPLAALPTQDPIHWRSGAAQSTSTDRAEMEAAARDALRGGDGGHVVVQLHGTPDAHTRARLGAAGLELVRPAGPNAWFAAVRGQRLDFAQLQSLRAFRGLGALRPEWKRSPALAQEIPAHAIVASGADPWIAVYALFHADVSLESARASAASLGAVTVDTLETVNGLVLELPRSALDALVAADAVQWVEAPLPRFDDLVNDSNRIVTQADTLQAAPYGLDGSGVTVLVYDGGFARDTHADFGGRLTVRDASGLSDHATHVAGTIGGSGVSSGGTLTGMAPAVVLESYGFEYDGTSIFLYANPGDVENDYSEAINTYGADIANNSIGTNTEPNGFPCNIQGDYGVMSSVIDAIVGGSLGAPFRVVWANGNERQGSACDVEGHGDYYSTAPPATAKNHIAVGALNSNDDSMTSFSSWGPTDDGRMKPDVSGPGCQTGGDGGVSSAGSASDTATAIKCGTSMSAPTVTGLCALLLEDYRVQFGGADPSNATLKVLLAQEAADGFNAGPDYQFGYGSVRVQDTLDFMRLGQFDEAAVADQGATFVYSVTVGAGDPELKVTLAWGDAPGTPNVFGALVNDLDLRVIAPGGAQHFPWTLDPANPALAAVRTQANRLDNIEQVLVDLPVAGTWRVEVHGYAVPQGPQAFSIASSHALTAGPFVDIGFPLGLPVSLAPGAGPTVRARIAATGESLVGGSPTLHYRTSGGSYLTATMVSVGGDEYEASLPALACGDVPEFYVSASGATSGATTSPPDAPASVYDATVEDLTVVFSDDFEADLGWTVSNVSLTDGGWERGVPAGDGGRNDPLNDFDGSGSCFLTDNVAGNSDVDGGPTRVTSPTIDLSGVAGEAIVSYAAWFANTTFDADDLAVEISDDGGSSWTTVESLGNTGGWQLRSFRVGDFVALTSQIVVRFSATDNPNDSVTEAALDAFRIVEHACTDVAPVANFSASPSTGEAPLSVDFTDLSTGSVTTWVWDFGDGASSTDEAPTHVYDLPGDYTVTLDVTGPLGSDGEVKTDFVVAAKPPQVGSNYGTGTPGSLGTPTIDGFSQLQLGTPLYFVGGNAPAATPTVLVLSTSQQAPAIDLSNGALLNVGLPIVIVKSLVTDDDGEAPYRLQLTPGISGITAFAQVFTVDGTGGDLYASSNGFQVTLP